MKKKHYNSLVPTSKQRYLYRLLGFKCIEVNAKYTSTFTPTTREEYGNEIDKMKKAIRKTGCKDDLRVVDLKYLDKENSDKLKSADDKGKELLPPTRQQLITFAHLIGVCRERGITPIAEPDVYTRKEFRKAVLYLAQKVNGPEPSCMPEGLRLEDDDDRLDSETILTVQDKTGTEEIN